MFDYERRIADFDACAVSTRPLGGRVPENGPDVDRSDRSAHARSASLIKRAPYAIAASGHSCQFERATDTSAWGPPSDLLLLRSEPALSANSGRSGSPPNPS